MAVKTRIYLSAFVLATLAFLISGNVYAQSYINPNGAQNLTTTINTSRYILFAGAHDIKGEDKTIYGVFKVDTYTGHTWRLMSEADKEGNQFDAWIEIPNPKKSENTPTVKSQIKELYQ